MSKRLWFSLMLMGAVAGCAAKAPPPAVQVVTREVFVPQKCVKAEEIPLKPRYQTHVGPYPGDVAAAKILARDFKAAKAYGRSMEVLLVGCALEDARSTK